MPPRSSMAMAPQEAERRAALVAAAAIRSAQQPGPRPTVLDHASPNQWEATHGAVSTQLRYVLRYHGIQYLDSYPEWIAHTDGLWANGLPSHLIDPAWAALYRTGVVASGPLPSIADPGCDPDGVIIQRLSACGLIALSGGSEHDQYQSLHTLSTRGLQAGLRGHLAG